MDNTTREAIRVRLDELTTLNNGRITPEIVVADAKDKDSPLHGQFNWNVDEAAYQHWIDTARGVIRSVYVELIEETRVLRVPAYLRDPSADSSEQGYVQTVRIRSERDNARAAVLYEFTRARAAMQRAKDIAEALAIDDAVEDIIVRIDTVRGSIQAEAPN